MEQKKEQLKPKVTRKRRKRSKSKKNHYFTQVHEDAIIRYTNTNCIKERKKTYTNGIHSTIKTYIFAYYPTRALITETTRKNVGKIFIFPEALPNAPLNILPESSIVLHFVPALDPVPVSDNVELIFS